MKNILTFKNVSKKKQTNNKQTMFRFALKKLQINMINTKPLAAKRVLRLTRRLTTPTYNVKTVKTAKTAKTAKTVKENDDPLGDIVGEYVAAYGVVGWGNTPIYKLEWVEDDGTYNVHVKDEQGAGITCYNVFAHEYIKPKLMDTFDVEHLTQMKVLANYIFIDLLATVYTKGQHVVVLDSPAGLTMTVVSALLTGMGVVDVCQFVHVPNPGFEALYEKTPRGQKYQKTMFEWLRDTDFKKEDKEQNIHAWFDYCCTFSGCATQTLPQTDLKLLLHRRLLPQRNGLLALTFSHRGVVGGSEGTVQAVYSWLNTVAGPMFGYRFTLCKQMAYGKITLIIFKTF